MIMITMVIIYLLSSIILGNSINLYTTTSYSNFICYINVIIVVSLNILINSNSNNIINKLNKSKDNNNFINNQSSNTIRDRNNYNIFSNFNENFGRQINPSINSIKKKENILPKSKVKNDITTDIKILVEVIS